MNGPLDWPTTRHRQHQPSNRAHAAVALIGIAAALSAALVLGALAVVLL